MIPQEGLLLRTFKFMSLSLSQSSLQDMLQVSLNSPSVAPILDLISNATSELRGFTGSQSLLTVAHSDSTVILTPLASNFWNSEQDLTLLKAHLFFVP